MYTLCTVWWGFELPCTQINSSQLCQFAFLCSQTATVIMSLFCLQPSTASSVLPTLNRGIIKVGKDLHDHQIQLLTNHHHINGTTALSATSSHFFNTFRDDDFTTSLSNTLQPFLWRNSCSCPTWTSPGTAWSHFPLPCRRFLGAETNSYLAPLRDLWRTIRFPLSLLFSTLNRNCLSHSSQDLFSRSFIIFIVLLQTHSSPSMLLQSWT